MKLTDPSVLAQARAGGYPFFPKTGIETAGPHNSAPYVIDESLIEATFGGSTRRDHLLQELRSLLSDIAPAMHVHALLVGGSMLNRSNLSPNDLDVVAFYSRKESDSRSLASQILSWQALYRGRGVDVRFVPTDAGPILLIKVSAFFCALYASGHGASAQGAILIDVDSNDET